MERRQRVMHRSDDETQSPQEFLGSELWSVASDQLAESIEHRIVFSCKQLACNAQWIGETP